MNNYTPRPWELLGALHDKCHNDSEESVRVPKFKIRKYKKMKLVDFERRLTDECWKVCKLQPINEETLYNVRRAIDSALREAWLRVLITHIPGFEVDVDRSTRDITVEFIDPLKDIWIGER